MTTQPHNTSHLTRVVVVTDSADGRTTTEFWADAWTLDTQDSGATLKLFGTGSGAVAKSKRGTRLAVWLGAAVGAISGI